MRRRLLNLLTALSLLLCVAVVVLWVRSYWRYDLAAASMGGAGGAAGSYRGCLLLGWGRDADAATAQIDYDSGDPAESIAAQVWADLRSAASWNVAGFTFTSAAASLSPELRVLVVPAWFVVLLAATPPAVQFRRRRTRRRRLSVGLCARCGYDLRATPERCPECGHVPAATATTSAGGR